MSNACPADAAKGRLGVAPSARRDSPTKPISDSSLSCNLCAIRATVKSLPARITITTIRWGWNCCALSPEKLRQEKHGASLGGNKRPHTLTQQVLLRRRMVASSSAPTAHGDALRGRLRRHISAATCTCTAPTRAQARIKLPVVPTTRPRLARSVTKLRSDGSSKRVNGEGSPACQTEISRSCNVQEHVVPAWTSHTPQCMRQTTRHGECGRKNSGRSNEANRNRTSLFSVRFDIVRGPTEIASAPQVPSEWTVCLRHRLTGHRHHTYNRSSRRCSGYQQERRASRGSQHIKTVCAPRKVHSRDRCTENADEKLSMPRKNVATCFRPGMKGLGVPPYVLFQLPSMCVLGLQHASRACAEARAPHQRACAERPR